MIDEFYINGIHWNVQWTNPSNPILVDRTNVLTCAVTDPETMTIYLSDRLKGEFLNQIHRMCKKRFWIEMEEFCANLLADYGRQIFGIAYSVLGEQAIHVVPYHMEKLVA